MCYYKDNERRCGNKAKYTMNIDDYLRFVAGRVVDAMARQDLAEVSRVLRLCAETCLEKATETEAKMQ